MRRASRTAIALAAIVSIAVVAEARQKSIAGTWTLTAENFPLRMVLLQHGSLVSGTLDYPHGAPFALNGEFAKGVLTFSGDSSGAGFTIHIDSKGSLGGDGSLAGTIAAHIVDRDESGQPVRTHDQELKWTAKRAPGK